MCAEQWVLIGNGNSTLEQVVGVMLFIESGGTRFALVLCVAITTIYGKCFFQIVLDIHREREIPTPRCTCLSTPVSSLRCFLNDDNFRCE